MPKKRYRPEEIIGKLREADVLLSQGKKVVDVIKALGVTDVTYYRWRQEFGGVITSYSIHYTKLYDCHRSRIQQTATQGFPDSARGEQIHETYSSVLPFPY